LQSHSGELDDDLGLKVKQEKRAAPARREGSYV
jgi:hypothetical protein